MELVFHLALPESTKLSDNWYTFVTRYLKDTGYQKNSDMIPNQLAHNETSCKRARLAIQDTLDVVGGKWKLVLITILRNGPKRFKELSREAGISPRVLSKELKELEMHGLVHREVCDTRPITVEYSLTPYSETLSDVIIAMHEWGVKHRAHIMQKG